MSLLRLRGLAGPFGVVLALQLALAWILASLVLSSRHSLADNGNWISTKTTLEVGVLGAYSYFFDLQPLADGALDLGAWHGYQEVVSKAEIDPVEIELDFALNPNAYLTVGFNRTGGEYTGLRVSVNDGFPAALLTISPEGEFVDRTPVEKLRRVRRRTPHILRIELGDDRFVVLLDDRRIGRFMTPIPRPQRISFRAGRGHAYIDDIRVVSKDGSVLVEDFGWTREQPRLAALFAAALALLSVVCFALLSRLLPGRERRLVFYFLMLSGLLVILAGIVFAFASYKKRLYPDEGRFLEAQQEYWKGNETERIFADLEARYPRTAAPGSRRVLFVGSSQTRGSGAARVEETLVRRTERLLADGTTDRVECLNAAIHGYTTIDMERTLRQSWLDWKPDLVVINAANNDLGIGIEAFEKHLESMVVLALERDARVLLVMEPNSIERGGVGLRAFHAVMREVGERHGVPTVDMHAHLLERYDEGFLWWDWVHLTSYGQRLFAEHLAAEIERLGLLEPAVTDRER